MYNTVNLIDDYNNCKQNLFFFFLIQFTFYKNNQKKKLIKLTSIF